MLAGQTALSRQGIFERSVDGAGRQAFSATVAAGIHNRLLFAHLDPHGADPGALAAVYAALRVSSDLPRRDELQYPLDGAEGTEDYIKLVDYWVEGLLNAAKKKGILN